MTRPQVGDFQVAIGALDHHEKLDRSGYPNGRGNISEISHVISIIDCYEALTNDDRPYRNAMPANKALELIKNDVEAGKYSNHVFEGFIHSLVSTKAQTQDLLN